MAEREQQRLDETIATIEEEVEARLNRRAEDHSERFGDGEHRENTIITSKMPHALKQLPHTKNTAIIIGISVLLLAALVVLIVLTLRLP